MRNKTQDKVMNKIASKLVGNDNIKKLVEAFDESINAVPEAQDHCVHCTECRDRASKTSIAFRSYFRRFLGR